MKLPALSVLPADLLAAVLKIAELARSAGGRALMVGGSVRDLLLGEETVKDVDLEVYGIEAERLRRLIGGAFRYHACGVSFGVLKICDFDIDVSLPRRESKSGLGHRAFEVESDPFLSLEEASSRRDFTVNAIYLDPLTGELLDPWHGVADLERRILRHVSEKFLEDPLRVLRGMQFVARFDLEPAPETVAICRRVGIEGLAPERLQEEWSKLLLKGRSIARGMNFLRATGWLQYFPELAALVGCEQDPEWHPEGDVWNHTLKSLDEFAKKRIGDAEEDLIVGLAVLCHDFGKPAVTAFDPERQRIRSPGHDVAGIEPTLHFLRRITADRNLLKSVPPLVKAHMQPFAMWKGQAGESAVRRLASRVGRIDRLLRVAAADAGAGEHEELRWLERMAEELKIKDSAPQPLLKGRHLLELGYRPSPQFSAWLGRCFEAQLDGEFTDLDGAIAYFKRQVMAANPSDAGKSGAPAANVQRI